MPLHDGGLKAVRTAVLLPPWDKARRPPSGHRVRLRRRRTLRRDPGLRRRAGRARSRRRSSRPGALRCSRSAPRWDQTAGRGSRSRSFATLVLPQVYRAAELGYIDINRVAVAGQSYGGYCTAALVSSTNLFRAAIAVSGIYDLASKYAVFRPGDELRRLVGREGAGPHGPVALERPASLRRQLALSSAPTASTRRSCSSMAAMTMAARCTTPRRCSWP